MAKILNTNTAPEFTDGGTTGGSYEPPYAPQNPGVCPGCGRCGTCGQLHQSSPVMPMPVTFCRQHINGTS